jgi:hypothetical protein
MPKLDPDLLAQARRVDLISYLHAAGHQPVYAKRTSALFHSPLREDRNPSFTVRFTEGAWKWVDWALSTHGDGIDLVMALKGIDFQTAVKELLGMAMSPGTIREDSRRQYTGREVRRIYFKWRDAMTPEREFLLRHYFLSRQLAYPERLGLIYLDLKVNQEGLTLPFLGIPVPSLHPRTMTTLECRALDDHTLQKQYRRRTFGDKALWVIRRPARALLVTESILDCLAGNQLLHNQTSLCALNTINNINQLLPCVQQLRPQTIYLALDNDPAKPSISEAAAQKPVTPGQAAQQKACTILVTAGYRVVEMRQHVLAGVKDLHKLLLHDSTPITLKDIEQHGIVHSPPAPR